MKRNGFTLVEVLAVLIILSIIMLIVTPSISSVYNDFKNKNNEALFEQLYKASKSYYLDNRATGVVKLTPENITNQAFLYQSWDESLTETTNKQIKININTLATEGFVKQNLISDTKNSLKVDNIYIYLLGKYNTQNSFIITDYALDEN